MKFEQGVGAVRPFDRNFWIYHLALPLVAATLVLASLERTGVDLWLADRWYAFEGYHWALRNHWLVNQVIHRDGKELLAGLGLALAITLAASYRLPRLQNWRRPIAYLLTCMVVLPALIAWSALFLPDPWRLASLAAGFGALMLYDLAIVKAGRAPLWYARLRLALTSVVLASLAIALMSI